MKVSKGYLGPPARCPFTPFLGEGSPTKIGYRKKWYPYSSLSTGGPRTISTINGGSIVNSLHGSGWIVLIPIGFEYDSLGPVFQKISFSKSTSIHSRRLFPLAARLDNLPVGADSRSFSQILAKVPATACGLRRVTLPPINMKPDLRGFGPFPLLKGPTFPKVGFHLGMGQNQTTRGPQVLVHVSIYQGSILGTYF